MTDEIRIIRNHGPINRPTPRYPFAELDVNDAFEMPDDLGVVMRSNGAISVRASRISSAAVAWVKRHGGGRKFSVHKSGRGTVICVRVK